MSGEILTSELEVAIANRRNLIELVENRRVETKNKIVALQIDDANDARLRDTLAAELNTLEKADALVKVKQ